MRADRTIRIKTKELENYLETVGINIEDISRGIGYSNKSVISYINNYMFSEKFRYKLADFLDIPFGKFCEDFTERK